MPAIDEEPTDDQLTHRPPPAGPRPLTARLVGTLMLVWTAVMGGWFGFEVIDGSIRSPALVLAVGGLLAVIWLLGLVILAVLLAGGESSTRP